MFVPNGQTFCGMRYLTPNRNEMELLVFVVIIIKIIKSKLKLIIMLPLTPFKQ